MPTQKPLRIGIIGAGAFASRRHLPDVQRDERTVLAAACRRSPEELKTVADHFSIPGRYTDWIEMLDREPLDGVIIATPHDQHALQAIEAMNRGLHVLLEKPMAITVSDAERILETAKRTDRTLAVALNAPYWRHTAIMREGIVEGRIGTLEYVDICWSGSAAAVFGRVPMPDQMPGIVKPTLFRADPAANGGGYLFDGGGHLMSELLWVTNRKPLEVSAMMDNVPDDMRASINIRLEGGLIAHIGAIGDSAYAERRIRSAYQGTTGTLTATGAPFAITWSEVGRHETEKEDQMPNVPSPVTDWINCILSGQTPRGSQEHGLDVSRLLEASYVSATTGKTVTLGG
ncbi:MAG: Gfo/Idh/MocA family oxidoreductase [Capsulimonadaceae bacterium]|nr:Gfo/Idh/MocA family oxidoreductase [Capsulimonadaceae bacterium]